MHIAIEGCAHGELDKIYESLLFIEEKHKIKIDLLLCCGDFQAVRNQSDLESMAVSNKHRRMNSFYKYYSGAVVAPILTVFIGGNHEASTHLFEVQYGGWVAENIYYLGHAGVVQFGGLRIAGISGIYKPYDYKKGRFEIPPFNDQSSKSAYHQREIDVKRLLELKNSDREIDIFLSHDWPVDVTKHGDLPYLLRIKPYFKEDIDRRQLGSPPCQTIMNELQPRYWFSAHLHCRFAAIVPHSSDRSTKFLALDKVIPKRHFLQLLEFPEPADPSEKKLKYDRDWLAILQSTFHLTSTRPYASDLPNPLTPSPILTPENLAKIDQLLIDSPFIPSNFVATQPPYPLRLPPDYPFPKTSLQMEHFLALLSLPNPYLTSNNNNSNNNNSNNNNNNNNNNENSNVIIKEANPDEIDIGDDDDDEDDAE